MQLSLNSQTQFKLK